MKTIYDLPIVLLEEILSKVPFGSMRTMRSTCKVWNALSKYQIFDKIAASARKQLFTVMDDKVYSMKFDLQKMRDDGNDYIGPSTKHVSLFGQVAIAQIIHCDGLLLFIKDKSWCVVWKPYLGQIRWIQPIDQSHEFRPSDMYAFGYDHNRNHKILRFVNVFAFEFRIVPFFEIYNFYSNSWKVLDVDPDFEIECCVSLKGNSYCLAQRKVKGNHNHWGSFPFRFDVEVFLLCFDFTLESFGPHLSLPFHSVDRCNEFIALSCVRDEQLALLHHRCYDHVINIWLTTKIEPNAVSWSKFLKVDSNQFTHIHKGFQAGSFFIDEERKVAAVADRKDFVPTETCRYQTAYIIGEDGYFKSVNVGQARREGVRYEPLVFSSYVPSLVQVQLPFIPRVCFSLR